MVRIVCVAMGVACVCAPVAAQPTPPPPGPPTTVAPVTVIARRPPPPIEGPRLELYEERDLLGGGVILVAPTPNLLARGFADRARSARAIGRWEVCDGAAFRPPCHVIEGELPMLGRLQLSERIASARPAP